MPIRFPCPLGQGNQPLAFTAARTALRALADASQVLQPNKCLGVGQCLLIAWFICSFNRLSRWPSAILRRVALRVPFRCNRFCTLA